MISIDGAEATLGQLVVRFLVSLLSVLALGLGYFWIAVDPNRQAWHDKIAGTYVIRQTAQPTRSASLSQAHPINWQFAIPCMLAVIGLPVAVAGGVFYWLASSDAYRVAKAYLEDHPAIIAKVGHSPEFGWLPSGKISKTSTGGQALLDVNVRGDVGELVARSLTGKPRRILGGSRGRLLRCQRTAGGDRTCRLKPECPAQALSSRVALHWTGSCGVLDRTPPAA